MAQTPVRAWRDPSDGKWHRGVEVWRRTTLYSLACVALYGSVLTARGDWGNNFYSYMAALWVGLTLLCLGGWARAHRRGWRPGGSRT